LGTHTSLSIQAITEHLAPWLCYMHTSG